MNGDPFVIAPLMELPPDFAELESEAVAEGFRHMARLRTQWAEGLRFQRPGEVLLGIWCDGVLTGVGGITLTADPTVARMRRVYIRRRDRRRGAGRALIQALEQRAIASGFGAIDLYTDTERGREFYEALGYSPLGPEANPSHRKDF